MPKRARQNPAHQRRIARIVDEIAKLQLVCSGTLIERTKRCGKPNCACATDPDARHGPYYEWSWRQEGRLAHKIVTPDQAEQLRTAIANHRRAQRLLERWNRESAAIILSQAPRKF